MRGIEGIEAALAAKGVRVVLEVAPHVRGVDAGQVRRDAHEGWEHAEVVAKHPGERGGHGGRGHPPHLAHEALPGARRGSYAEIAGQLGVEGVPGCLGDEPAEGEVHIEKAEPLRDLVGGLDVLGRGEFGWAESACVQPQVDPKSRGVAVVGNSKKGARCL
jgi:hypothetical protein